MTMSPVLNNEQKKAVETKDSSLLIVAGAGTGKTHVLVEKIVHLLGSGVRADSILALTFTNKAADEMRERVHSHCSAAHLLFVGTFHSFCVSLLRTFSDAGSVPEHFIIFDRNDCKRIIKRCMKQVGITDYTPRVMQHAVGRLKTERTDAVDSDIAVAADRLLPLYSAAMEEEKALDFDDLIIKAVAMLERDGRVRDQVRSRYAYLLIDEFQDTDGVQNRLITLLKGPQTNIVAVGDTDQTIYSWRGADVDNMLDFADRYAPAATVLLVQNYRSSATILAAANAVIEKNVLRQDKHLISTRYEGPPIACIRAVDQEDEAACIAREIIQLRAGGVPYSDIAVLFRTNFQSRALETAMIADHLPYTMLGVRFFDRAEIKDLLTYLILVQNPVSEDAFRRAAGIPRRGIGARTLDKIFSGEEHMLSARGATVVAKLRSDIAEIRHCAAKHTVSHVLRELTDLLSYKDYLIASYDNPEDRMLEVYELITFADRFSNLSGTDGTDRLLTEVALSSDQDTLRTEKKDGVRLMTVHAAKGLEFSHVFITGMEEGLFPFLYDEDALRDREEERRLCYVAMTRAKDRLYFSFAQRRGMFGSYKSMRPSSFLNDIPEHLFEKSRSAGKNDGGDILW